MLPGPYPLLGDWPAFAFPVAHAGKRLAVPPFTVFERWKSMLRAGMRVGRGFERFSGGAKTKAALQAASCPPFRLSQGGLFEKHEGWGSPTCCPV